MAPPPEARGKAAGQVVLLDQQRLQPARARRGRRRQSAVARADDDDVVLPVQCTYLLVNGIVSAYLPDDSVQTC